MINTEIENRMSHRQLTPDCVAFSYITVGSSKQGVTERVMGERVWSVFNF